MRQMCRANPILRSLVTWMMATRSPLMVTLSRFLSVCPSHRLHLLPKFADTTSLISTTAHGAPTAWEVADLANSTGLSPAVAETSLLSVQTTALSEIPRTQILKLSLLTGFIRADQYSQQFAIQRALVGPPSNDSQPS